MSGALVPPLLAEAIVQFPTTAATGLGPETLRWMQTNWTASGPVPLLDVAFVALQSLLVIGIALFLARLSMDPVRTAGELERHNVLVPGIPAGDATARYLDGRLFRLALIGGVFLALTSAVVPAIAVQVTGLRGEAALDGFAVVLLTSLIASAIGRTEG